MLRALFVVLVEVDFGGKRKSENFRSSTTFQSWLGPTSDVLTIFQLAYRQHDLLANNHVGRLLCRYPTTAFYARRRLTQQLTSSFAPPLMTDKKVSSIHDDVLCRSKRTVQLRSSNNFLFHRRGSLRLINWPIVEEAYDS